MLVKYLSICLVCCLDRWLVPIVFMLFCVSTIKKSSTICDLQTQLLVAEIPQHSGCCHHGDKPNLPQLKWGACSPLVKQWDVSCSHKVCICCTTCCEWGMSVCLHFILYKSPSMSISPLKIYLLFWRKARCDPSACGIPREVHQDKCNSLTPCVP